MNTRALNLRKAFFKSNPKEMDLEDANAENLGFVLSVAAEYDHIDKVYNASDAWYFRTKSKIELNVLTFEDISKHKYSYTYPNKK